MAFTWWHRARILFLRWRMRLRLTEYRLIKCGDEVAFLINELPIFDWRDDGVSYGAVLGGGKIGMRQMAPLIGEYSNLVVRTVRRAGGS